MAVAVAGYFMTGILALPYEILMAFCKPTQPEERGFSRKRVEQCEHLFEIALDSRFERRPALDARHSGTVQDVEPIFDVNSQARKQLAIQSMLEW